MEIVTNDLILKQGAIDDWEDLMNIQNAVKDISELYPGGQFDLAAWKRYAFHIHPALPGLCVEDLEKCLSTGQVTFQEDYLPILNEAYRDREGRERTIAAFESAVSGLEARVQEVFGRCPEVEIILYLGLCNGAGWVTELGGKPVILLGLEKIMELKWWDLPSMYGLIYHELGHIYQARFGVLERKCSSAREEFLWQLFTEGIAMHFEQVLVGDPDFYHQDKDGWKAWCSAHLAQIKADFGTDLRHMTFENQRYFGDWVRYHGHGDVGYYLGGRFVDFLCEEKEFDSLLSFEIGQVEDAFQEFIQAPGGMFQIETERLLLRPISEEDQGDIFEILSDDQTCLDDGGFHGLKKRDEEFFSVFAWMKGQRRYAIELKSEHKLIGLVNLQDEERAVPAYELGFVLNPRFRRRGYAYEAVQGVINAWFEMTKVQMFTASHFPDNAASKGLIQKLGFIWEGTERKAMNHAVLGPIDLVCYYREKE